MRRSRRCWPNRAVTERWRAWTCGEHTDWARGGLDRDQLGVGIAVNGGCPVLVPVDGSANALRAVHHAIVEYRRHHELELHRLNVQAPLSRHIARFVSRHDRHTWQRDRAGAAMAGARSVLTRAGVPHHTHGVCGTSAVENCRAAERLGAHHIVI